MATTAGKLAYSFYRALTYGVSPLLYLRLRWRKFRGLEHPDRWSQRLGRPSLPRPPGPLLWFHAVSLGEGMAALTMIKYCIKRRPHTRILMTTTNSAAFEVIKTKLPSGVIYQVAPYDAPSAMDAFLRYWKPSIALALLNARISENSFSRWSIPIFRPLISLMLSKFSLIVPLGTVQAIRFQLLNAPPFIINFSGDLKYSMTATSEYDPLHSHMNECGTFKNTVEDIDQLHDQFAGRKVWMASSIHRGEEKVIIEVHKKLTLVYPEVLAVIVPRYPFDGLEIIKECDREGLDFALRSRRDLILPSTSVYIVDTLGTSSVLFLNVRVHVIDLPLPAISWTQLMQYDTMTGKCCLAGELQELYRLAPIAVIGGSFLPGFAGHNISEAAVASCHHVGHFLQMITQMQQLNPLSVKQVSGSLELGNEIIHLFGDCNDLEARRVAGKHALDALSNGVAESIWNELEFHIFRQALHEEAG
ncbi:unnamed protein product [Rhodiola kirilowii]